MLVGLDHPNFCRVVGLCTAQDPFCVCTEYLVHGDLKQFLRKHVPEEYASRNHGTTKMLRFVLPLVISFDLLYQTEAWKFYSIKQKRGSFL